MKRYLNRPRIRRSSQNALNLLHFLRRFDIIRKHGKLVWLSRQSDSLVMNRSAVRIRPPAPQKPARLSGFPCSPWAYSYRSLTQVYPTRKSQIFPRGTPTSPARLCSQTRCAACAIPSRSRSLRIRPPAPHSRKASIAAPRKVLRGVCVFTPAENQRFSPGGPRYLPHAHCQGSFPAGTRALLAGIFGRVRCGDEKARGVPRAFALPDRASPR